MADKEAWKRERPFRAAVIEQCTYDGTIYDAERIVERIGALCDYVVFDEAWAGFMKFHPLYERRFAMGLRELRRSLARHCRHPVGAQAARQLLAGVPDPCARPAHQGPAPAGRASPLQRRLHAVRLDLAVLSAVRFARRRRADDEGPIGGSLVGRHDPAWDRVAQEIARRPARVRGEGARPDAALVLRSVRAAARLDPGRRARGRDPRRAVGERVDRPARPRSALLGFGAGRALARLSVARTGLRHHRSGQAHLAHSGLRSLNRRLRSARRARLPSSPNICARTGWWRRRTISTRCSSC